MLKEKENLTTGEVLKEVKDLFENDKVVLMQAEFENKKVISAGVKDFAGDIVKIIDICEM